MTTKEERHLELSNGILVDTVEKRCRSIMLFLDVRQASTRQI